MVATARSACPKCGTARTNATACPTCGLATDRMAGFASQLDDTVPEVARRAWDEARAHWGNAAAHDEVLRLTTLHGCYAWAAARYREARGEEASADPIAARELERIRRAAEVALLASREARLAKDEPKSYRSTVMLLLVLVAVIGVGLVYAMSRRGGVPHQPPRSPHSATRVR